MRRKKRILIVGTGSIGERHLKCFLSTGRAEVSVCEVDGGLRRRIVEGYEVGGEFRELGEALSAGQDGVVIATPAHLHIPMARQAIEAGLPVLIEKPLSTSLAGVEALRQAGEGRVVGVAYIYRSYPMLVAMKAAVDEGRFGRPLHLIAVSGQHFPTYRPAYRDIYYADPARGGGAIQDALTHLINAGMWLVGPLDRVVADAAHQSLEGVEVEDTVNVLTRHGAVLGSYSLNQHQAPNETVLTVVCERGTARVEFQKKRWSWMTDPGTDWEVESWPELERDDVFAEQARGFLDAIEGQGEMACSLGEGIRTLECMIAVMASVRSESKWVHVPVIPEAE